MDSRPIRRPGYKHIEIPVCLDKAGGAVGDVDGRPFPSIARCPLPPRSVVVSNTMAVVGGSTNKENGRIVRRTSHTTAASSAVVRPCNSSSVASVEIFCELVFPVQRVNAGGFALAAADKRKGLGPVDD